MFINLLRPLADFIHAQFPMLGEYDTLIIALTFTVFTCLVYFCMKKFIDNVFCLLYTSAPACRRRGAAAAPAAPAGSGKSVS